jgi:hypothetical protein
MKAYYMVEEQTAGVRDGIDEGGGNERDDDAKAQLPSVVPAEEIHQTVH